MLTCNRGWPARKIFAKAYTLSIKIDVGSELVERPQFIAWEEAKCEEIELALKTAVEIELEFSREQVLADIALAQAKGSDVKGASITAKKLHPLSRTMFWRGLAEWQRDQKGQGSSEIIAERTRKLDQGG